jgi:serine/threonine-protein kinase RsbW
MNQPDTRVLQTSAGPHALAEIVTAFERVWSAHPCVPAVERMHMELAAGEIGANIVEHAAAARQVWMTMDVVVSSEQVQVEFTDDGDSVGVDLDAVALPDHMAERGRGLALARSVLATLAYRRDSDLNHWILVGKPFVS